MLDSDETVTISAPDNLRSIGFPDLILPKASQEHQETVTSSLDFTSQKPKQFTELIHLVSWSNAFIQALESNQNNLATLELLRGANEVPISLAKFRVAECINVVSSAANLDVCLVVQHPDSRANFYAINNILVEDSTCMHDIIRQVFACLYSKCLVRLIVKSNSFYQAVMATYLVDLMHSCGASFSEISCYGFEKREAIGNERFQKSYATNKTSKLSTIAIVFKDTDTFAAAQGIIESYYREQYPNLIILVEELAYERFVQDWQRYYSFALHIGPRLDERTTVVESVNEKVKVDLAAIDIKASHKMSGQVINMLRFRSPSDLLSMLSNFRKVPYMSIWNNDILMAREFCLRTNQCSEFWLNHRPRSLAGRRFPEDILNFYGETVAEDMVYIYNSVYSQFADEAEQLRKLSATFAKKNESLKRMLIISTFVTILEKCKSLRVASTVGESVARLKRFEHGSLHHVSMPGDGESQVETLYKPVGLAIIFVREEGNVKNKAALLEMVFKNLIVGNAVLLACPPGTFGAKFAFNNDHVIPFKMVHEVLPDISRLSLDASIEAGETSLCKKQCPKNTFAIEFLPDMNEESCETITVALGTRRKSLWVPDSDQSNYWVDE